MGQTEAGCRLIIGMMLINAMDMAKGVYHLPSNALFHEYVIAHPNLPGIGQISGPVDFLASSTENDISSNLNPDIAPGERKFLVIEAKRGPTVNEAASFAQLYAQLFTVQHLDR